MWRMNRRECRRKGQWLGTSLSRTRKHPVTLWAYIRELVNSREKIRISDDYVTNLGEEISETY
jgi:hypothetical protein